jgi:hypothetical protein
MRRSFGVFCAAVVLAVLILAGAGAAAAAPFGKEEMKRMSVFLSNFTELGFYDFDVKEESDEALCLAAPDLILFGIWHNYFNNFESRVKDCTVKDCEHGSLTIEGKFVQESVKKYFDLDLKNQSVMESDSQYFLYFFDGKLYHFEGANGEPVYSAEVKEASREGDIVHMSGELYNAEDEEDRPATFKAVAKPHKWAGKETWAILSMRTEYK